MLAVEAKVAGWLIWSGGRPGARYRASWSSLAWRGKRAIPATLLWLPAMPLALYGLGLMQIQGWLGGLLQMVLLGSAFAHLMLLRARHRLQAFNLLLPWRGLVSAILSLIWLAVLGVGRGAAPGSTR